MSSKPNILITNDDGINAPGINYLCKALAPFANITIVAPELEQSAVGLSITIRHPLRIDKVDWTEPTPAWKVNGTPADCVKLALNVILKTTPDLIVSGINRGLNSGRNIFYSGTVAGVIEGIMHDIPGIAFSCHDFDTPDYATAAKHVPSIVQYALQHPLPKGTFLNVNFPPISCKEIKGIRLTRQGKEFWKENLDKRAHPTEGHAYYWLGAQLATFEEHEESDITWLKKGYIAAVPVHVEELTDHRHLLEHKERFDNLMLSTQ